MSGNIMRLIFIRYSRPFLLLCSFLTFLFLFDNILHDLVLSATETRLRRGRDAVEQHSDDRKVKYNFTSCDDLYTFKGLEYEILPDVFNVRSEMSTEIYDVTIAVHLNYARIRTFAIMLRNWPGQISAAILIAPQERQHAETLLTLLLRNRFNVEIHLVIEHVQSFYPVNMLRNLALDQVHTSHALLLDTDFCLLSANVHAILLDWIDVYRGDKDILVLPAFEMLADKREFYNVTDKAAMKKDWEAKVIITFHDSFYAAHGPTDYKKWFSTNVPYNINFKFFYEPYIVVRKSAVLPRYDDRFVAYEWNKHAFILELTSLQYQFKVLPDAYVVHYNHDKSTDLNLRNNTHSCITNLFKSFAANLVRRNPTMFSIFPKWIQDCPQFHAVRPTKLAARGKPVGRKRIDEGEEKREMENQKEETTTRHSKNEFMTTSDKRSAMVKKLMREHKLNQVTKSSEWDFADSETVPI